MLSVELPPALTDVGVNEAEAPVGRPETLRYTDSALPETTAVEIVAVPEVDCSKLKLAGLTEIE